MRLAFALIPCVALLSCGCFALLSCGSSGGNRGASEASPKKQAKVKITQFYATGGKVPKGLKGSLCYGVENAAKMQLDPPVAEVWPALTRCFEIAPAKKTTYTLTAFGEDGSTDKQSVDVDTAAAPPRLFDLSVNKIDVAKGEDVMVCFKVENTVRVKAGPGRFDAAKNCIFDQPKKTTTYRIQALGGDREMDSGTVTVKVH